MTFYGCKTINKTYYSYKLNNYTVQNNVGGLWSSSSFISYNDYIFEFIIRTKFKSDIYIESNKKISKKEFDTVGVYILKDKCNFYWQFDSFALGNKLIKTGKIEDKEFGLSLNQASVSPDFSKSGEFKDTVINHQEYSFLEFLIKKVDGSDSTLSRIFFIKDSKFNTIYKMSGIIYPNKKYSMAGYSHYLFDKKIEIISLVEEIKVINESENKICQNILSKVNSQIADSVKKQ